MRECFFALPELFEESFAVDRRYSPCFDVLVSPVEDFLQFPNLVAVTRTVGRMGFHFPKVEGAWFDVNRRLFPELCGEGGGAVDIGEAEVAALEGVG